MDQSKWSIWVPAASLVVTVCALVFTVFSFWWINARRGRLKAFEPHTFAFALTQTQVRLRLPLVFYSTGAPPIIVQDLSLHFRRRLRLRLLKADLAKPLHWVATRSQLKPDAEDGHDFPAVFFTGRTAQRMFIEFGSGSLGFTLEARPYTVRVKAKLGHKRRWRKILDFTLQAGQITVPDRFITYENTPSSQWRQQEAKAALREHQSGS